MLQRKYRYLLPEIRSFDTGMIELADIGFAHKDLNISKNIFKDYEGLFSDFYLERVLEYIKEVRKCGIYELTIF